MKTKRLLRFLGRFLIEISRKKKKRKKKRIAVRLQINSLDTGEIDMKNAVLHPDKKIMVGVKLFAPKQRELPINDTPVWSVSAPGFVALFPSPDGKTCEWAWLAAAESTTVTVSVTTADGVVMTDTCVVKTAQPVADHLEMAIGDEVDL